MSYNTLRSQVYASLNSLTEEAPPIPIHFELKLRKVDSTYPKKRWHALPNSTSIQRVTATDVGARESLSRTDRNLLSSVQL